MTSLARENARRAGVEQVISWRTMPAEQFYRREPFGCLVCNPPYGERTGESFQVEALYRSLGQIFIRLDRWSAFILTAHPRFEQQFGRRADRNRKMYNGNMKTYLYQYFGPLPHASGPGTGVPTPGDPAPDAP